jgi:hypothetical protein
VPGPETLPWLPEFILKIIAAEKPIVVVVVLLKPKQVNFVVRFLKFTDENIMTQFISQIFRIRIRTKHHGSATPVGFSGSGSAVPTVA